jgi:polysaccharide export outer membrane protein
MKSLVRILFFAILALAGFNVHAQQEPILIAGQSVQLKLMGVPNDETMHVSGPYTISSQGMLKLPYITEISASGLTPTALQKKIEITYKAQEIYTHPTVTIQTTTDFMAQSVITVGGEVRAPTEIPFRPGINLYAAISRAGGPTEFANMKKVKLLRGKSESVYDLRKVGSENNPELKAGDQIIIPPG